MTIQEIIKDVVVLFFVVFVILLICGLIKYIVDRVEDRKDKELEIKKVDLYSYIDPVRVMNALSDWIQSYLRNYILINFTIQNVEFINQDMTKLMIKEVTTQVTIEMSDYYLTLIKLRYNLNNDDDLIKHIYSLVSDEALMIVTEYNKSE